MNRNKRTCHLLTLDFCDDKFVFMLIVLVVSTGNLGFILPSDYFIQFSNGKNVPCFAVFLSVEAHFRRQFGKP